MCEEVSSVRFPMRPVLRRSHELLSFCTRILGSTEDLSSASPEPVVLSFDIEEHHWIEAAAGVKIDVDLAGQYHDRMSAATEWILELLHQWRVHATFFIVGLIAEKNPRLIRSIHDAGHEVASHGWDHRRLHLLDPHAFREDVQKSKQAIEQATGSKVVGYRAPSFSVVHQTGWAIDVLADLGFLYDSSIYPVYHDRYGVPEAPKGSFVVRGKESEILEIPPATMTLGRVGIPVGGGGYFRLLPSSLMRLALTISRRHADTDTTMLYFHPWEFDPEQPRLPLKGLNRFRTYVGMGQSRNRLRHLLSWYDFTRAVDVARSLDKKRDELPRFQLLP